MPADAGAPQTPSTPAPVAPVADGGRPPAAAGPVTAARHSPEGGVKDTVESILVAFILAFVFRAFVVEAFVIPTGSMAPTLLGAHMRFTCADCGYHYTVNYSTNPDLNIPTRAPGTLRQPVHCPNCGYAVPDKPNSSGEDSRQNPPVHYGDRILVLKYRYLLAGPQRWDVVVFKAPDIVQNAPRYTTNYIKRLIGRPNESVGMLDGDIYVSTAKPGEDLDHKAAREAFLRTFKVQTKPGYAQEALWRDVYDNDHMPHLARPSDPWTQPWTVAAAAGGGGSGWDVGQNLPAPETGRTRVFRFDNPAGDGRIAFDPNANPETFAFTDYLAYDQLREGGPRVVPRNTVGDLRLSCFYTRQGGDGPFAMTLGKRDDVFAAEVTPGKVRIVWQKANGRPVETFGPVDVPELAGSGPVRLDFANVDFRVALRVNGREVLTSGERYFPTGDQVVELERAESRRNGQQDPRLPRAELSAARQRCVLEHVQMARDVFYINDQNAGAMGGQLNGSPDRPVVLGPDEYFVMGDNAPISGDARIWREPVRLPGEGLPYVEAGRVPARFMLGKAFFVYWPAGHRPLNGQVEFGLVPNFGEMRFIH